MLSKNKAIVLSKVKYNDNDLILKCYTAERGLISYLVRGAYSSKSKSGKMGYFQVLSQLQIEEDFKPNRSLQYIREIKSLFIYNSLQTNLHKSSLAMFLAEVLTSALKEESKNEDLFNYISGSLDYLDHETEVANFHLMFLLQLTKYLGFYPELPQETTTYFDLESGLFTNQAALYTIEGLQVELLQQLLKMPFEAYPQIKLNAQGRVAFLNVLLLYFELQLGYFKKPKSVEVLNQVWH
ncbi:DNA repair protein RecO [Paucihalobacter ruber]|uniref:DNA repair protein RecO n=1 Tax=Paucihalobacter ruber TaxID=2567861 RepID=A0A506PNG7_9FLAO|nr:DNA repair protein RecO [Paucihalobacter ruber]TPV34747.1 DNA repair protein RecO [Paucihalobacter ruber]